MRMLSRRSFFGMMAAGLALGSGCRKTAESASSRVVLYCAQDREFAETVLGDFTTASGLPVDPRYDTEANKSVSLYNELVAEKDRPRCDVFWNNEIVSTIRLRKQNLLEAHESPAAATYPASAKASDHTWHAFAARARVLIVNNALLPAAERPRSLLDLAENEFFRGKVVMAKPQFGTTATQMACLFEVLGVSAAKQFLQGLHANQTRIAPGNKQVAEWVVAGRTPTGQVVSVGMTDTDDAIGEVRAGRNVSIIFPDREGATVDRAGNNHARMGTLFIPNTLCIPKNCPNLSGARQLVDYLLSAAVETRLAEGPGAQIPLNPEVNATLHPQIQTPSRHKVAMMRVDWERAADLWNQAQEAVNQLFAEGR